MIAFFGFKGADLQAFSRLFEILRKRSIPFEICPETTEPALSREWPLPEVLRGHYPPTAAMRDPYWKLCSAFDSRRIDEAEQSLSRIGTRLAVWCPGQIDGLIGRAAAIRLGLPLICLLPPFFEFKALQPFSCPPAAPKERFVAAGPLGEERLVRAGAPRDRIARLGSPRLEPYLECASPASAGRGSEVLVPLQGEAEEEAMIDLIEGWIGRNEGCSLSLRPHPSLVRLEKIPAVPPAGAPIAGEPLVEALSRAFAVVSRNSMVLLEAILAGVAAISWQDRALPPEITFAWTGGLAAAHGRKELESALSAALSARSDGARADRAREARGLVFAGKGRPAENIADFLERLAA